MTRSYKLKLWPVPPWPSFQFSMITQPSCAFWMMFTAGLRPGGGGGAFAGRVSGL
jgi:hypothetical protein